MRRALRRLFSILLTLFLTSLAALWALSSLESRFAAARPDLPNFFNPSPRNAQMLAGALLEKLARGGDLELVKRELSRLGGAALPHVLTRFDTLPPLERGRAALALGEIAARMNISSPSDFSTPESAVLFWTRFWQDREMDFKPQLVRRLVTRLAEKSSVLRSEDVIQLDTYALPELVRALERTRGREGVLRARRLTLVLSHVTELPWVVEAEMSEEAADRVVARWRRFWLESGSDFTNPEGALQVAQMFLETRYAHWLRGYASPSGASVFGIGLGQALRSAAGVLFAVLVSLALGSGLTGWVFLRHGARRRLAAQILGVLLASLPVAYWLAVFGSPASPVFGHVVSVLVSGLAGGAALSLLATRAMSREEAPALSSRLAHAALALPALLPWLLGSLVALEVTLGLDTAGRAALRGLFAGDLGPGMTLALCSALAVCLLTANTRALSTAAAPRLREPSLVEVGGARRKAALATFVLLGALLALTFVSLRPPADRPGLALVALLARSVLLTGTVTLGVAAVVGFALGTLRVRTARALDSLLARAVEVQAALPAAVWAAAFAVALGTGLRLALALGALRALDVAWLYRTEHVRTSLEPRDSMLTGRPTPDPLSFRTRRTLAGPARALLALTPAWAAAVASAVTVLGLTPGQTEFRLLSAPPPSSAALTAVASLVLAGTSAVLLAWGAPLPRKIGALRASWPPPEHSPTEPPPSVRPSRPSAAPETRDR